MIKRLVSIQKEHVEVGVALLYFLGIIKKISVNVASEKGLCRDSLVGVGMRKRFVGVWSENVAVS